MYETQRVILIDDNEADNVFHEIILRRAGFDGELLCHESAESALAALPANLHPPKPTLIFLDINMPGMDGFQFVSAAAETLASHGPIVLVMLTSSTLESDLKRARELPLIRDYVIKPLVLEKARALLASYFDGPDPA